jgi:hypothetical protein
MLSQEERQRLDEIERQLLADDPQFVARMRSARRRPGVATMVLLTAWAVAVTIAVVTQSTPMMIGLAALLLVEAGWRLYRRRHQPLSATAVERRTTG